MAPPIASIYRFPSLAALATYQGPPAIDYAFVQSGRVPSYWVSSSAAADPSQPWQLSAAGGGSWSLVPLGGRIAAGTLSTLHDDALACFQLNAVLVIPDGAPPTINQTVTLPGVISIESESENAYVSGDGLDGPAFEFNFQPPNTTPVIPRFSVRLRYVLINASPTSYANSCAFALTGSRGTAEVAANYIYHADFDIVAAGCFSGMVVDVDPVYTTFGLESPVYYCGFRVRVEAGNNPTQWGIWWKQGSGTGNVFHEISGPLNAYPYPSPVTDAAYLRYEAGRPVVFNGNTLITIVGDILFGAGHLGGDHGALFSFGSGLNYLNEISVVGCQFDDNMTDFAYFDNPQTYLTGVKSIGNNNGGGNFSFSGQSSTVMPPISQSVVDDREVSCWRCGRVVIDDRPPVSGGYTQDLFSVTLAPYTASRVELQVSGVVFGSESGLSEMTYYVQSDGQYIAWNPGLSNGTNNSPFAFATPTLNGLTITFHATHSPVMSGPSTIDAQIAVKGGKFTVTRAPDT